MSAESFVIGVGFMENASMTLLSDSIAVLQDSAKAATSDANLPKAIGTSEETKEADDDDKLTF